MIAKCFSPWTNIDINPQGAIAPCCKFLTKEYDQRFNIQHNSLNEYFDSEMLISVKQDFNNGVWPAGCKRCQIDEENNIASKRQLDFNRWKSHYKNYSGEGLLTASVAFGNTCNLSCITCNSATSSKWRREYKDIYNINGPKVEFVNTKFVDSIIAVSNDIVHFDIPGGEPFLSSVNIQKELLQKYIDNNQAKNISLHYTTNAQIFPDDNWWESWKHFKEVDIQLSIDGVGSHYEYIRFPGSWKTLLSNANKYLEYQQKFSFLKLSVSHTVSAYNIYYLHEFHHWCENTGLPAPYLGRVHYPRHMVPEVWPDNVKQKINKKLKDSKYQEVNAWGDLILAVKSPMSEFDKFCYYLGLHDQYRKLNFKKTFPEMSEIGFV